MADEARDPDVHLTVNILDTLTGERRVYRYFGPCVGEFIWSEGNYACDCNRARFFAYALDEDEPDSPPCGNERYKIKVIEDGGEVLFEDAEYGR